MPNQLTSAQVGAISAQLGRECAIIGQRVWAARQFSGVRLEIATDKPLPANIDECELTVPGYLVGDIYRSAPSRLDLLLVECPGEPFDPATWLAKFETVGGRYVITEADHITVGWQVFGKDEAAQLRARELYREIEHDDVRRAQLKAHILKTRKDLQPAMD
jgi:hypothetical protein